MIRSISFQNYRSFKTKQTIDIKPITILVGPNSSGKSSILKLFGLLKQSVINRSPHKLHQEDLLKYNGEEVQLESLEDICYRKQPGTLNISFEGDVYLGSSDFGLFREGNIDADPNMSVRTGNHTFKCTLNIKYAGIESFMESIKVRESEFSGDIPTDKTRDRFRIMSSGHPGSTVFELYTHSKEENNKIIKKNIRKFTNRGILSNGAIFTLDGYVIKSKETTHLIIEDIKKDLSKIIINLKNINNKYNKESNLDREIHEIIDFVHYEMWLGGSSFYPDFFVREGNSLGDSSRVEIVKRPTPYHGYLKNWEEVPFKNYGPICGTIPAKAQDDINVLSDIEKRHSDEHYGKSTQGGKILYDYVLERIIKHWKTVEKSDSYSNPKYKKNIEQTIWWYITDLVEHYPNPYYESRSKVKDAVKRFMDLMSTSIRENLFQIENIGAIRPSPKKFYTINDLRFILADDTSGSKKMGLEYSSKKDGELKTTYAAEETYLSMLGFDHSIDIRRISDTQDLYTITLMNPKDKIPMTVDKFGFGFSQILPLVFAKNFRNKLIIVEQPELHLHPKAQSGLADLFSKRVWEYFDKKPGGKRKQAPPTAEGIFRSVNILEEFGFVEKRTIEYEKDLPDDIQNKFLIETHSEHMIRRLQVLIANGELSNDDVAIYYVDKNRLGNSFVKEYKINERGFFIEPWPEGFFDSTSKSLMELWKPR